MNYIKLNQYTLDQIIDNTWFKNSNYELDQGYTKTNLLPYIEKAFKSYIKKNLRFSMITGTMRDNEGILSQFSNVKDWQDQAEEDKDPLYELAHQVKCEGVRLYNCIRFNL